MDGYRNTWILSLYALCVAGFVTAIHAMYNPRPMFNRTDRNVTYHTGDTAVLPCSVRNLGTKEVIWKMKQQKHVISVGNFVFTAENSYSVDHRDDSDDWNLVIKNVKKQHAGLFECQISTREDMNITVRLNVIDAPKRKHTSVDRDRQRVKNVKLVPAVHISGPDFVNKGESVFLTCNASGPITPDDIDWFKDGTKIRPSSSAHVYITKYRKAETKTLYSALEIKHAHMNDMGTYICRSSDLEIESHSLMVLNASSEQRKRHQDGKEENPTNDNNTSLKKQLQTSQNSGESLHQTNVHYSLIVLTAMNVFVGMCCGMPFPT